MERSQGYFLVTYGCQKNEYDSEIIMATLEKMGYEKREKPDGADLIVLNTCCVRDNADQKVYGRITQYKAHRYSNENLIFVVTGCLAQKDREQLVKRFRHVDIVLGTHQLGELQAAIRQVENARKPFVACDITGTFDDLPVKRSSSHFAWVPISEGCDCHCTYCIVPFVRGRLKSRPQDAIVREVKDFAGRGGKEITLLGQNVNAYGMDRAARGGFGELLTAINAIEGLARIRFMSPHPANFSESLIETMGRLEKVCPHIHLPLQAGHDRVLRRMGRGYTTAHYRLLVEKLRAHMPRVALTTDLIVGFPGETEEEFLATMDFIEELQFDGAFMFAYSEREGAAATGMKEVIPPQERLARLHVLIERQNAITLMKNQEEAGSSDTVLVECVSKKDSAMLRGKTGRNKLVHFEGKAELIGEMIQVNLDHPFTWGFLGRIAGETQSHHNY